MALSFAAVSGLASFWVDNTASAETSSAATSSSDKLEEVVVTARRRAIQSAIEIKKDAETSLDSIVADDAGKLPDNSLTEVLARVPGVQMARFDFTDHFTTEGSGIQVRGMNGVAGRLNGREIFSAAGGWGLSWDDVTPELMAGVDVYKGATADMIEGGTGGQIDLRTKMPFDYAPGWIMEGSAGANYADISKKLSPKASMLVSNRWNTGLGEFGALLDVSFSRFQEESNFFRMEPYHRVALFRSRDGAGNPQDWFDGYVPAGFDYGYENQKHDRYGVYAALQWKPVDNLEISQSAFYARHQLEGGSTGVFVTGSQAGPWGYDTWCGDGVHKVYCNVGSANNASNAIVVDATDPNTVLDANDALVKADNVFTRNPNTLLPDGNMNISGNTNFATTQSWTRDISTSFKWTATDRLSFRGAAQFVRSENHHKGYDIFPSMNFPGQFSLDLTGAYPRVTYPAANLPQLANQANFNWYAHMPSLQYNAGTMRAFNVDMDFALSSTGFFRTLRAGVRYAERQESDNSYYGWTNLCAGWDGCDPTTRTFDPAHTPNQNDIMYETFPNFFRGNTPVPGAVWMPAFQLAQKLDPTYVSNTYGNSSGCGDPAGVTCLHNSWQFGPYDGLKESSLNRSAYVLLRFALGNWLDGNAGVRVIHNRNYSTGFYNQSGLFYTPQATTADPNPAPAPIPGTFSNELYGGIPSAGGTKSTRGVPNINVRIKPFENFQIRLGYNITLDQPGFGDSKATGSVSAVTHSNPNDNTAPPILDGYSSDAGNPQLRPQFATNYDLAFEWYPKKDAAVHLSLFRKDIKDELLYQQSNRPAPVWMKDGSVQYVSAGVTQTVNASRPAVAKGVEVGGSMFFDMLPAPFNHFGIDANYTFIESHSPGDYWTDIDGGVHNDSPIRGLSKNSYNFQLMYETKPFSARLAWNWRSKSMQGVNGVGTNIGYTYLGPPNEGTVTSGLPAGTIANFNATLPVYADKYGQLDFGMSYHFSDKLSVNLDLNNVLNDVPRSIMTGYLNKATGAHDAEHYRSWYLADRRINLGLRWKL